MTWTHHYIKIWTAILHAVCYLNSNSGTKLGKKMITIHSQFNSECHSSCLLHAICTWASLIHNEKIHLTGSHWWRHSIPVKYATTSLVHPPQPRWGIALCKLHSALIFWGVFVSLPDLHNSWGNKDIPWK